MTYFCSAILTVAAGLNTPVPGVPQADTDTNQPPKPVLRTGSIEGQPWPCTPWPVIDESERGAVEAEINAEVATLAGNDLPSGEVVKPLRTRFLLVGGDLLRDDLMRIGTTLDRTVQKMHSLMGALPEDAPFAGRLGLVLVPERDAYVLLLADRFGTYASSTNAAVLQVNQRRAIVVANSGAPRGLLDYQLDRVVVHAYLHALYSPGRLPAWANEGLATAVAWSNVMPGAGRGRTDAISRVRGGFDLSTLLVRNYEDGSWIADEQSECLAGLLMERLLRERPDQLRAWILAVKQGEPWETSFTSSFNDGPGAFVEWARRYYMVND